MKRILFAGLVALQLLTAADATAQVITFDDLGTSSESLAINGEYAGFKWSNFNYLTPALYAIADTGYTYGNVSGSNVAFNENALSAYFSRSTGFDFISAYVTKAWDDGSTLFQGYVGDNLVYSKTVASTTTTPTLATFNWSGVTKVVMVGGGEYSHTVIDNLTVAAVPEPETYLLMATGLLLGFMARRKKQ